jgi:hypothetical protein
VFISVYQRQCWLPATMLAGLLATNLLGDLTRHFVRPRPDILVCVEEKQHMGCSRTHSMQGGAVG